MLTAYLICLVVGGVFVAMSLFAEAGTHAGHEAHGDAMGHDHAFIPFTSLRFWTFGSCFFGLTGVALSELTTLGEPTTALVSGALGIAAGSASAWLVRRLRRPVGATGSPEQWVGLSGELLLPLAPGALSKVRVAAGGRERDLVVTLAEGPALPKGTRVVILRVDPQGPAVVAPETSMFPNEVSR